jgi:glucose/arabinose dehydrogenase
VIGRWRWLRLAAGTALVVSSVVFGSPPATDAYSPGSIDASLQAVSSGYDDPVLVTNAGDGSGRLFVVEQTGYVRTTAAGAGGTPFLDVHTRVILGSERGLLGLAFHPDFSSNGRLYVSYTRADDGAFVIDEYRVTSNPNVVSTSTRRRIFITPHPNGNHNGGNIAFGPDGYLYIGTGDGGTGGDNAQKTGNVLGKMLRIDVDHTSGTRQYAIPPTNPYLGISGRDEIWSRGLRNPWRWSFDRSTGDLWIADVGQTAWEEVNRARASGGGGRKANFGWNTMEGSHCFKPSSGCPTSGRRIPVHEYTHSVSGDDNCSVTGGFVYRGSAFPAMAGGYFFGDYCSGRIWAISANARTPATSTLLLDTSLSISSFGESEAGELYVVDRGGGTIYRLVDS